MPESDAEDRQEDRDAERYDKFEARVLELVKELEDEDESTTCAVFMGVMGTMMAKAMNGRDPEDYNGDPMLLLQDLLTCVGEEALHEYKEDHEHYFTFGKLSIDVWRHKESQLERA